MRRVYISKNYPGISNGGTKGKRDMERIMDGMGFINIGCRPTFTKNKILGFLYTLRSVIVGLFNLKKGDYLVLFYPFKKYYSFICNIAHFKEAKLITLIYDFGYYRRKRVTREEEKKKLSKNDYLLVVNKYMKQELLDQDYKMPIGIFHLWDVLSDSPETKPIEKNELSNPVEVIYAGGLKPGLHDFMYILDRECPPRNYKYTIYGTRFIPGQITHTGKIQGLGFVPTDDIIKTTTGDWGLVWYGNSIGEIDGAYGEYLRLTTSHKPCTYMRCHIPVISWSQAAFADFVREHNVGICIDSLNQLDEILSELSQEEYDIMKNNAIEVSNKLEQGYYFKTAYLEAEKYLMNN
ncbi:MAG: galactofuranosyltransferase [Prevotella sp.]|jgi:hypothetical protein|nr:galactofuranosyltransferase [Prevotella sp.]